jgi:enolase
MEVTAFPEGGVENVVAEFEDRIASELRGMDAADTGSIDGVLKEIDGTENFSAIGGNTAVAVSLAAAKAAASSYNMPLYQFLGGNFACGIPYPLGNMINGGTRR